MMDQPEMELCVVCMRVFWSATGCDTCENCWLELNDTRESREVETEEDT